MNSIEHLCKKVPVLGKPEQLGYSPNLNLVMKYLLKKFELNEILTQAENELGKSEKHKFQRILKWRKEFVPDFPGVYALYEKVNNVFELLYIGESGNMRARMSDVCSTINHTFRRQLAIKRFNIEKIEKKYSVEVEQQLNKFFDENLYASFIKVNFGRAEIESYLVTKYQSQLLNSESKRKLKIELDQLSN